jgi:hypothetical protein
MGGGVFLFNLLLYLEMNNIESSDFELLRLTSLKLLLPFIRLNQCIII